MKGLNNPIGIKSSDPNQSPFITNPYRFAAAGGGIGGWTELARTTLGSVNADITVSSLPDKRYYMYLVDGHRTSVTVDGFVRLGNGSVDTGSNYSRRLSSGGGSDSTVINQAGISDWYPSTGDLNFLTVGYISNLSGNEKLIMDTLYETNKDKTMIIVSHNKSNLSKCDYILEIQNKSVIRVLNKK